MRLFVTLRRHARRRLLFIAIVLGVVSGGLSTGLLFLINQYLFVWGESLRVPAALVFVVLLPAVAAMRYLSSSALATLGAFTSCDLQLELTRRILAAPLRRLEELGNHRLLVALTDDINSVTDALAGIPSFFINVTVVAGCLVYMGWLSPALLAVVGLFLLVGAVTYLLPLQAGVRRQELAREVEDELFGHFQGATRGTKELKMRSARRASFLTLLERTAVSFRDLHLKATKIFIGSQVWGNLLFFVLVGLLLFLLPLYISGLDSSVQASYVVVLLYILGPLQFVLGEFPNLTQADVAVRKIERLGISLSEALPDEGVVAEAPAFRRLELAGVAYAYGAEDEGRGFHVGPIDLELRPGELVFLVGGNGSGKTTLAKLLLGLYPTAEGEIRLDGRKVAPEELEDYRQLFSPVFSDFFLFESLLGLDAPDLDDRAREYLVELQLQHKARVDHGELSTVELSQGQRKRLALMAALLEDRPIYLFDEWAADQDPEFKEIFYRRLLPALREKGKLIVAISHDDRYYHTGDRVVRLEDGRLVFDRPAGEVADALPWAAGA